MIAFNSFNGAGRIPQAAVASTWRTKEGALAFESWKDYAPQIET